MSYLVLARKYRPQKFEEIVGQDSVTRTLTNSISKSKIPQAVLLTGVRGIGKTTAARIFAKALNCEKGPTPIPCNQCTNCREITLSSSMDVMEIDGASNTGVNDIRELKENVRYLPSKSKFKIYIIDEVHMLSESAFNALLKTLEEPPQNVIFIFATTEPEKIPETIVSRCQRFDLRPIPQEKIFGRLKEISAEEKFAISEFTLRIIAREGKGSMRDSLSILDKIVAYGGAEISDEEVIEILGLVKRDFLHNAACAILQRDPKKVIGIVDDLYRQGYDPKQFLAELLEYFRNLLVLKVDDAGRFSGFPKEELDEMAFLAGNATVEELEILFDIIKASLIEISRSDQQRFIIEFAMIKAAGMQNLARIDDVIKNLEGMEKKFGSNPKNIPSSFDNGIKAPVRELEEVNFDWENIVSGIKEKKPSLAAIIANGTGKIAGNVLKIAFAGGSFHMDMVSERENLEYIKGFVNNLLGKKLDVEIVEGDVAEKKPAAQVAKSMPAQADNVRQPKPGPEGAVKKALTILGGKLDQDM